MYAYCVCVCVGRQVVGTNVRGDDESIGKPSIGRESSLTRTLNRIRSQVVQK